MGHLFLNHIKDELENLEKQGLYKQEWIISSPQAADIELYDHVHVLNFCSNNYLGLANHPKVVAAAQKGLKEYGFGLASVRFICGTQTVHKQLEAKISDFLQKEDAILYSSCFDANGGLFETLLGPEDAVISDALNHASIIDGIRLCKAKRFRYQNNDTHDLEQKLQEAKECRFRLIATDGVFSMDGIISNLRSICDLAEKYDALVMVDDCHATGFLGNTGKGTHEYWDVVQRIDILTGTLGKALGGGSGGYTAGNKDVIAWLRQKSRPYLFSNTLSPSIAQASLAVFEILEEEGETLRKKLFENTAYFRRQMTDLGFELAGKDHPIIPVMLKEASMTQTFAKKMLEEGIYVVGFFFPVVPQGKARIRTQMSSAHERKDLDRALEAFAKVGKALGVIQ